MEAVTVEKVSEAPTSTTSVVVSDTETGESVNGLAQHVDPYEAAYWRSGENGALETWLLDLFERGCFEVVETRNWLWTERRLAIAENGSAVKTLSDLERDLVDWFAVPRKGIDIFTSRLPECLTAACSVYRARLQ